LNPSSLAAVDLPVPLSPTVLRDSSLYSFDPAFLPDYKPIGAYGIIGDHRTAVLVGADGSIDWACLPDYDSDAVFCAILDPDAGCFAVRPTEPFRTHQRYERGTNVLVTEMATAGGRVRVRDFMPFFEGRKVPTAELHRRIEGVSGEVEMEIVFAPRFDYGATVPTLTQEPNGVRAAVSETEAIILSTTIPLELREGTVVGRVTMRAGGEEILVADWGAGRIHHVASYQSARRLDYVRSYWRRWTDRLTYHGRYRDAVERSLLALKLLVSEPSGAIVAAPTTSLPEWPGGARNWDYRFSWVRDSAFVLRALFGAGYVEEGTAYFDWLLGHALEEEPLRVLYGINGQQDLQERELPLRGYRDSRPVRVGNGAAHQFQLDIYGSLLDAALHYDRSGGILTIEEWEKLRAMTERVRERWRQPDAGIWEARNEPRHYTYSKVWAWVALTRAARLAERTNMDVPLDEWKAEAEEIRAEVLEQAWNPEVGAFTQAYGYPDLDASVLVMPTVGFIAADDPRFRQTVETVLRELAAGPFPLLYRYHNDDGVGGPEGAFLLPSFWLVEALALGGEVARARAALAALMEHASPLGLFSEEVHPETQELLGNFPQGFSHLGLVNAVFRLEAVKQTDLAAAW
jgi:GH15 family glucan-1,4-alpha-glucosidase